MLPPGPLRLPLALPVIAAPLFIVSGPGLVIAQCCAGVIGSFPALNARPKDTLDAWIVRIKAETAAFAAAHPGAVVAPFAVNQIAHASNDRLDHDVEVCVRHEVPIVITSLRAPRRVVDAVHAYGGVVLHDVINMRHAAKALDDGVDGLIAVCAGAGGHAGTLSPFAFVHELRAAFDGPIALSGSIADGASILAARALGADFAYIGTRFIASAEANADPDYKQMLIDHAASDVVYSSLFTGVHGNYLRPSIARAGLDPNALPEADKSTMNFGSAALGEAKAWRDIWGSGQGIGGIADAPPVARIVERMRAEYDAARARLADEATAAAV